MWVALPRQGHSVEAEKGLRNTLVNGLCVLSLETYVGSADPGFLCLVKARHRQYCSDRKPLWQERLCEQTGGKWLCLGKECSETYPALSSCSCRAPGQYLAFAEHPGAKPLCKSAVGSLILVSACPSPACSALPPVTPATSAQQNCRASP